jgi:hypothetical protein
MNQIDARRLNVKNEMLKTTKGYEVKTFRVGLPERVFA